MIEQCAVSVAVVGEDSGEGSGSERRTHHRQRAAAGINYSASVEVIVADRDRCDLHDE